MTANLASRDPDRYLDPRRGLCATRLLWCAPWELIDHEAEGSAREEAEGVRVAYVAATRARDLLVVTAVAEKELPGWLSPLNKAIYPPGGVLWWDLSTLRLDVEARLGLHDHRMLSGDSAESLAAYEAWRESRKRAIDRGADPAMEVLIPSELPDSPGIEVPVHVHTGPTIERPGGRRFGSLVHAILRDSGLDPSQVESLARAHGRTMGASEEEIEAAMAAASHTLGHPVLARAKAAERCHRELPISLQLSPTRRVEGTIDLAFLDSGKWTIVDFKTDVNLAPQRAHYERQLRWYALALSRLTSQPVECWLLGI